MTSKIRVSDLLEDESGRMHLGVDYIDVGGDQRKLIVPRALILEPRRIVSRLLDEGAQLHRERAVADVQAAIDNAPKTPTGLLVNRHGWHGEVYVTSNETRSWHGWRRHVSLVMLAFAMMAAIRVHANTMAPPPKTTRCKAKTPNRPQS